MLTGRTYHHTWLAVLQFIDSRERIDPAFGDSGAKIDIDEVLNSIKEPHDSIADVLLRLSYNGLINISVAERYRCRRLRNTEADRVWLRNH
jgi:hypothetical protein